ncbi:hypothetical protein TrLO_g14552 [Triparma laevis f. longispina]|uniref:Aminotransferase class I/classII large domain-containing protein n=1 Tax=Triparma laevis f. longispina TaxID=1714387 RepID=A0A9W7L0G3_9STRA|nr:hypothetical protein TrLO_g14552 [Triparma laevis f. longispina]
MSVYFYISISTYLLLKQRSYELSESVSPPKITNEHSNVERNINDSTTLSPRGTSTLQPILSYFSLFIQCLQNPHSSDNPMGLISLCVAENKLCHEMLEERFKKTKGFEGKESFSYDDMSGLLSLKTSMASLVTRKFIHDKYNVKPESLVISSGAASILDHLSFLLASPGEGCMIPTPFYAAFVNDMSVRGQLNILPLNSTLGQPTVSNLEVLWKDSMEKGVRPRILLLTNPHNPTGVISSVECLRGSVEWARRKGMHVIVDEIYALSTFSGDKFTSIIEVLEGNLGNNVHVIWALSKDFGSSGLRVGCLISHNSEVINGLNNVNVFSSVSNPMQLACAEVLGDEKWVDEYLEESNLRLRRAYEVVTGGLRGLGIPYTEAKAGMFVWLDLSSLLPEKSWEGEDALTSLIFEEGGIVLTPGQSQKTSTPGFYRLCFAYNTMESLKVALARLEYVVGVVRERGWVDLDVEEMDEVNEGGVRRRGSSWVGED